MSSHPQNPNQHSPISSPCMAIPIHSDLSDSDCDTDPNLSNPVHTDSDFDSDSNVSGSPSSVIQDTNHSAVACDDSLISESSLYEGVGITICGTYCAM